MCGRQWDRIKLKWYLCWGRACSVLSRHPSYCYKAYIVPIHISYGYHFLFHRRSSSCWTAIEIGLVDMLSSKFRSCSRMSSYLQLTLTIKIKIKWRNTAAASRVRAPIPPSPPCIHAIYALYQLRYAYYSMKSPFNSTTLVMEMAEHTFNK